VDCQDSLEPPHSDAIEQLFLPFISRKFPFADPEWQKLRRKAEIRHALRYIRRRLFGFMQSADVFNATVKQTYDAIWADQDFERDFIPDRSVSPIEWHEFGYFANAAVTQRVQQFAMAHVIRQLPLKTAIEVGSGRGLNLFVLAGIFPDISWTGIELTDSGVSATQSLIDSPTPPAGIARFSPEPQSDAQAYRRIKVHQGSAAALPFDDNQFDLVYTRLALEQMEPIRRQALAEIARVAKSYVLMVEPFRDVNASGLRRHYIVGSNYFQAWIADLQEYGLKPILRFEDWPNKITLKAALIVAKVDKR
jgi:SAM-dependent methyltransferase